MRGARLDNLDTIFFAPLFILYSPATYLEVYKECVLTSNNNHLSTLTRSSRLAHAVRRDERTIMKDLLLRRHVNCAPRS